MTHSIKRTVLAPVVLAASLMALSANAQEVAMVYASNVTATNALSNVKPVLTPEALAKAFSQELTADLNTRLPKEQVELNESLRLRNDFTSSIRAELDVRLRQEMGQLTAVVTD